MNWSDILPAISAISVVGGGAVIQALLARRERHAGARKSDAESESLSVSTMSAVLRTAKAENAELQREKQHLVDALRALRAYIREAREHARRDGHTLLPMTPELRDQLDDIEE